MNLLSERVSRVVSEQILAPYSKIVAFTVKD